MSPPSAMLTHAQIWEAIDALAARAGTSPSGLARRAGLDPTTFNKSKRITPDQHHARSIRCSRGWTTGRNPHGADDRSRPGRQRDLFRRARISPWGRLGRARNSGARGPQRLCAGDFRRRTVAGLPRRHLIIASPAASIRRGDRVVVKLRGGEVIVRELARKTAKALDLKPLNPAQSDRTLATEDYLWIARIVWASQ